MIFLLFTISDKRYALASEHIVEVIPNILEPKKNITRTPEYFAGHINFRDSLLPVIDLCQLHAGTPCPKKLSSRIILTRYRKNDGSHETIGMLAEKITETIRPAKEKSSIIHTSSGISYLLKEKAGQKEKIEIFDQDRMLPNNFDIYCLK